MAVLTFLYELKQSGKKASSKDELDMINKST